MFDLLRLLPLNFFVLFSHRATSSSTLFRSQVATTFSLLRSAPALRSTKPTTALFIRQHHSNSMARKITITLHRADLRLVESSHELGVLQYWPCPPFFSVHDNVLVSTAHDQKSDSTHVLPIYVFDERFIELSGFPGYTREGPAAKTRVCGFWRTSAFRARWVSHRGSLHRFFIVTLQSLLTTTKFSW